MSNYLNKINYALKISFYISVFLLIAGNIYDIFTVYNNDIAVLFINVSTISLVLLTLLLELGHILQTKTAFGIIIGIMILNLYLGLFMYDKEIAPATSTAILYRESILVLILISISSFFINRYLSYTILISYFIIYFIFIYHYSNQFVFSNSILILFLFSAYTFIIGYFKNILNRILEDLQSKNKKINEHLEEIKVQNQQLQTQQKTIILQNSSLISKNNDLKNHKTKLTELNQAKDKFFSIIAHDLKNPFNSVLGFSNLLVDKIKEKDFEKASKISLLIHNSSKNIYNLLINLLEWSHIQTGKIEFNPKWINLEKCLNNILNLMEDNYKLKSISIIKEIEPAIKIWGDPNMINTIFRNLLSNAIKYSYENSEVLINCSTKNNNLVLVVSDKGIGIKDENIKKLFRLDTSFTKAGTLKEMGTGLGLILCKDFVEYHNGKIWVESEFGKGSDFYIQLPGLLSKK